MAVRAVRAVRARASRRHGGATDARDVRAQRVEPGAHRRRRRVPWWGPGRVDRRIDRAHRVHRVGFGACRRSLRRGCAVHSTRRGNGLPRLRAPRRGGQAQDRRRRPWRRRRRARDGADGVAAPGPARPRRGRRPVQCGRRAHRRRARARRAPWRGLREGRLVRGSVECVGSRRRRVPVPRRSGRDVRGDAGDDARRVH